MTTQEKKDLVFRFTELMATQQFERFGEIIAQDYKQHNPMIKQGLAGITEGSQWFLAVFPDLTVEVNHLILENDMISGHFTWSGTQQREFMGLPASYQKATWNSMDIWRIENGKLAEHWDVVDWAGLMGQLQQK